MGNLLGASWLTTVLGVVAAVTGGLSAMPVLPVGWQQWVQVLFALSVGGIGVAAKAYNASNAPVPAPTGIVVESPAAAKVAAKTVPVRVIK